MWGQVPARSPFAPYTPITRLVAEVRERADAVFDSTDRIDKSPLLIELGAAARARETVSQAAEELAQAADELKRACADVDAAVGEQDDDETYA